MLATVGVAAVRHSPHPWHGPQLHSSLQPRVSFFHTGSTCGARPSSLMTSHIVLQSPWQPTPPQSRYAFSCVRVSKVRSRVAHSGQPPQKLSHEHFSSQSATSPSSDG